MQPIRRYTRYACTGSAELNDGGTGRIWGEIVDLSSAAFYMSTFGPWPVGKQVNLQLQSEEMVIDGTGVVVTSHPGVGMAVLFSDLSSDSQAVLQELVHTLAGKNATDEGAAAAS